MCLMNYTRQPHMPSHLTPGDGDCGCPGTGVARTGALPSRRPQPGEGRTIQGGQVSTTMWTLPGWEESFRSGRGSASRIQTLLS